jgi:hypothetical protein
MHVSLKLGSGDKRSLSILWTEINSEVMRSRSADGRFGNFEPQGRKRLDRCRHWVPPSLGCKCKRMDSRDIRNAHGGALANGFGKTACRVRRVKRACATHHSQKAPR